MSTLHLQVGQAGIQVGQRAFELIGPDFAPSQILIDIESKTLEKVRRSEYAHATRQKFILDKRAIGRGGNWALGYSDKNILSETLDTMRRSLEECDFYQGSILYHSTTGGTGSGFGSLLLEKLRDELPNRYLISASILPSSTGDSPLQTINSLMSLYYLNNYADCVLMFPNDDLHLHDFSSTLSGLIHPLRDRVRGTSLNFDGWVTISGLAPIPGLKLVSCLSSTSSCLDRLCKLLKQPTNDQNTPKRCFASHLYNRSDSILRLGDAEQQLSKRLGYADDINHRPLDIFNSTRPSNHIPQLSLFFNSNTPVLEQGRIIISRGKKFLESRAYMHWYCAHLPDFVEHYRDALDDFVVCTELYKSL